MNISSLNIETLVVGELKTNCYLLSSEGKGMLIDPGDEADFILDKITQRNLKLKKILLTHGHFDHILATGQIQKTLNCKVFLNRDDVSLAKKALVSAKHYLSGEVVFLPFKISEFFKKNKTYKFENYSYKVIPLPGHTPGLVGFYFKKENLLFLGDMIFSQGGLGRTDFSYSDSKQFEKSLEALSLLPKETIVFPGHGESFTLGNWQNLDIVF